MQYDVIQLHAHLFNELNDIFTFGLHQIHNTMYRGTTPTLILTVSDFDYMHATIIEVTLIDRANHVVKYDKSNIRYDRETKRMFIQMTQADTLKLAGDVKLQMRFETENGNNVIATNVATIRFNSSLSTEILGDDDPTGQARINNEIPLTPDSNNADILIAAAWGTTIEGQPRIMDIYVNGQKCPIVDGEVFITIPTKVSDLQGYSAISEAITTNTRNIATLTTETAEQGRNIASLTTAINGTNQELNVVKGQVTSQGDAINSTNNKIAEVAARIATVESKTQDQQIAINNKVEKSSFDLTVANINSAVDALENEVPKKVDAENIATINGQKITNGGNVDVAGMTDAEKQQLNENTQKVATLEEETSNFITASVEVRGGKNWLVLTSKNNQQ